LSQGYRASHTLCRKAYPPGKQDSCEHNGKTDAESRKWRPSIIEGKVAVYQYSPDRLSILEIVTQRKLEILKEKENLEDLGENGGKVLSNEKTGHILDSCNSTGGQAES